MEVINDNFERPENQNVTNELPQQESPQTPPTAGTIPPLRAERRDIPPCPKTYLVFAILVTIFCCVPFGIPAIVFAAKVENYYRVGDYLMAEESSRKARMWSIISLILGIALIVVFFLSIAVFGVSLSELLSDNPFFFEDLFN